MSFEVKAEGVDVQRLFADVYKRIAEPEAGAVHRGGAAFHRRRAGGAGPRLAAFAPEAAEGTTGASLPPRATS